MDIIKREIEPQIVKSLVSNKVVVLLGPRRVGKTVLLAQVMEK